MSFTSQAAVTSSTIQKQKFTHVDFAAISIAAKIHRLVMAAASTNGGIWVSIGGGTANVAAGIIASHLGITFDLANYALDSAGYALFGTSYYDIWYDVAYSPIEDEYYFAIESIVNFACKGVTVTQKKDTIL